MPFLTTVLRTVRRARVASVAFAAVAGAVSLTTPAQAQRFNPTTAAPSLGAFPTTAGVYTFNTTGVKIWVNPPGGIPYQKTVPTVSGPNNYYKYGVFSQGCALFAWDSITVGSGQKLVGKGSSPLVLLSRSSVVVQAGGRIVVDGENGAGYGVAGAGGAGGYRGGDRKDFANNIPAQDGFGPGASDASATASGGAGHYDSGSLSSGSWGGPGYGTSLAVKLEGGSGSGGTDDAGGAGGGGAVEISAVSSIQVNGTGVAGLAAVSAAGGRGAGMDTGVAGPSAGDKGGSGGGSGGAIYLAAPSVSASGWGTDVFSVAGGDAYFLGTSAFGGPGAGGRIRVEYSGAAPSQTTGNIWTRAGSHIYGNGSWSSAAPGELVIAPY